MDLCVSRLVVLLCLIGVYFSFGAHDTADARGKGGSVSVKGYVRKDGTYVAPHQRSAPDGSFYNNWSTKGNINPYTGKEGTKTAPSVGSGNKTTPPLNLEPQSSVPADASTSSGKPETNLTFPSQTDNIQLGNGECNSGYFKQGDVCVPQ